MMNVTLGYVMVTRGTIDRDDEIYFYLYMNCDELEHLMNGTQTGHQYHVLPILSIIPVVDLPSTNEMTSTLPPLSITRSLPTIVSIV